VLRLRACCNSGHHLVCLAGTCPRRRLNDGLQWDRHPLQRHLAIALSQQPPPVNSGVPSYSAGVAHRGLCLTRKIWWLSIGHLGQISKNRNFFCGFPAPARNYKKMGPIMANDSSDQGLAAPGRAGGQTRARSALCLAQIRGLPRAARQWAPVFPEQTRGFIRGKTSAAGTGRVG